LKEKLRKKFNQVLYIALSGMFSKSELRELLNNYDITRIDTLDILLKILNNESIFTNKDTYFIISNALGKAKVQLDTEKV